MIDPHSITPPPELVQQWVSLACEYEGDETWIDLATQAARWGADMELEACCEWLEDADLDDSQKVSWVNLRAARRPEPQSLKERALKALDNISIASFEQDAANTIWHALEQLDD